MTVSSNALVEIAIRLFPPDHNFHKLKGCPDYNNDKNNCAHVVMMVKRVASDNPKSI